MAIIPTRFNLNKFFGIVVFILLQYFLIFWVYALTILILNYVGINTLSYWGVGILGVIAVPFSGYLMGMTSAFCWRRQSWNEWQIEKEGFNLLMWFWLLTSIIVLSQVIKWQPFSLQTPSLITVVSFFSIVIVVFLVHAFGFFKGQKYGHQFVKNDELSQLIGHTNQWEQSETDKEDNSAER